MADFFPSDIHFWLIFTIPIVAAIVGWGTNVIAIKMTFYPLEYKGKWPFGWQGIIPSKSDKMAGKSVDLLTTKLINIETIFSQIDPKRVAEEMTDALEPLSKDIINQSMNAHMPLAWAIIPKRTKESIYADAAKQFPKVIEKMMVEIKANIKDILDVRRMAVEALTKNKSLLNEIFLKCGVEEFKFIKRSGLYFGFIFGIIQMLIWLLLDYWWLLPLGGLIIGYATNWLALKLIFRPLKPIKIGPFTIQGMFIKRQKEVSKEYAKIMSSEVLTVPNMFNFVIKEGPSDLLVNLTTTNVRKGVDKTAGLNRTLIKIVAGSKKYEQISDLATERFVEELPGSIHYMFKYTEVALDIENILREKMIALPPNEYEGTLRPAFQEEELTLILVGAALGCIAGFLQLLLLIV